MSEQELLQKYESQRQPVECWTRVVGYFRSLSHFNEGKQSEFKYRKWFVEKGFGHKIFGHGTDTEKAKSVKKRQEKARKGNGFFSKNN